MDKILYQKLFDATKTAFTKLFTEHDEHYYYCTLIISDIRTCPFISAWSHEAFARFIEENNISENKKPDYEWSYADSPYCAYGWECFSDAKQYVNEHRPDLNDDDKTWENWCSSMFDAMEQVMKKLDSEKLFGTGKKRSETLINAEIMPPDYTNTQRALRLNKKKHILYWLENVAESDDE